MSSSNQQNDDDQELHHEQHHHHQNYNDDEITNENTSHEIDVNHQNQNDDENDPSKKPDNGDDANQQQDEVSQQEVHHGTASLKITVINVCCNVIGGGILSLPSGFAKASPIFGTFLMLFTTAITFTNLKFIVDSATAANEFNYGELVKKTLGKFATVSLVALTLFPFGALIAYCRIVADSMPPVMIQFLGITGFFAQEETWLVLGAIVFFILSARRHLSELFISSVFGLITIFFAVFCVLVRWLDGSYTTPGSEYLPKTYEKNVEEYNLLYLKSHASEMISLTAFAVSVHNNAPAYYQHLKNRSPKKIMRTFSWAHLIIISTYLIISWAGFLTFGETRLQQINGDIIHGYSEEDSLLNVARLLLFIHFVAVYPILQMAVRRGLNNLLYGPEGENLPMHILYMETAGIVIASALIAYVVPAIDVLLSINGALFGSIIIMVVPSCLYLKLVKQSDPYSWTRLMAMASLAYAAIVAILSLISTFTD